MGSSYSGFKKPTADRWKGNWANQNNAQDQGKDDGQFSNIFGSKFDLSKLEKATGSIVATTQSAFEDRRAFTEHLIAQLPLQYQFLLNSSTKICVVVFV